MSGATPIRSSQSLPDLSCSSDLTLSFSSPSSSRKSSSVSTFGADGNFTDKLSWLEICGALRTVLELLGLSDIINRAISLYYSKRSEYHPLKTKQANFPHPSSKRLLLFILWTVGCISLSLVSGLYVLSRDMFRSQFYTAALRLGITPSSQQSSQNQKDDAQPTSVSNTILQDRLEVANLAVKRLRSEGMVLQEKLKEAGMRITRLEASQADHAAFQALQARYGQVSAEIARLTEENEELKNKLAQLGKENAELRQCLAIKEPDEKDASNHLGMLARLQNQQLDSSSCIFSKGDESEKNAEGEAADASEDSIVIVSGTEPPRRDFGGPDMKSTHLFSFSMPLPPTTIITQPSSQGLLTSYFPSQTSDIGHVPPSSISSGNSNPIPVFVTKRPSLPPKSSKLKPLLLATRNGTRQGPRRNSVRQPRKNSFNAPPPINQIENTANNKPSNNRALNPLAPAFTPRSPTMTITAATAPPAEAADPNKENETKPVPATSSVSKAPSPSSSPFIITSPSPNSPFVRPPPPRRQSEDVHFPTLITTPPTPSTPIPTSTRSNKSSNASRPLLASISEFGGTSKGTPRSTRVSSVKLIRDRAAIRNSNRVASGSDAIMPGSPAGFKEMTMRACSLGSESGPRSRSIPNLNSKVSQVNAAKARLIGKGMPPPRRALGEVTNAEGMRSENSISRWTSA